MDISTLTTFFMWTTFINLVLLFIAFFFTAFAGDRVYRIHTTWYPMTRETFTVVIYSILGLYKVLVIFFSLVPYIALSIVG